MQTGTIKELWRFPVKSFRGERIEQAECEAKGLLGDRAYALIEKASNKVVTANSIKRFPDLLDCRAEFVKPPKRGEVMPAVVITLPDGSSTTSDSGEVDNLLSSYFGIEVTLASVAPMDYTIDQYHPDLEGLHPAGFRDVSVEQKLGSALFAELGMDSAVPVGSFMDVFPLSVITTSSLNRLKELSPESNVDVSRFRMNVVLETSDPGFAENDWIGRAFTLGNKVQMMVAMPDPRCVMTTLPQNGLPKDTSILKTLAQHNRLDIGPGKFPCAGVYAVITVSGTVRVGDTISSL
jgi:uncharacterized protein